MSKGLEIRLSYIPVINFALQQNHVPIIREIILRNTGEEQIDDIDLVVQFKPEFALEYSQHLDSIAPGKFVRISVVPISVSTEFLSSLTERMKGTVSLTARSGDELLAEKHCDISILTFNEWGGSGIMPESLAAFSTPNHPGITVINKRASEFLGRWTGDPSLNAYQNRDHNRVKYQMAAIYEAIAEKAITYCVSPASFESQGQRIRTVDEIMSLKMANCLDMTMLYASCLEAAGLHPLVIVTEDHAFAGCWLIPDSFPDSVVDDPALITKRMADGMNEILVVECTAMNEGSHASFDQACDAAKQKMFSGEVTFFIDVCRARIGQIRPLPIRTVDDEGNYVVEDTEEARNGAAPTDMSATDLVIDTDAVVTRKIIWERKLLDLTLRNNLLNLKITKGTIPFISANIGTLEDALANNEDFKVCAKPTDWDCELLSDGIYKTINATDPILEIIQQELRLNRIHAYLEEEPLRKSLTHLYRTAKISMEENGANTLYLALGLLKWYETPSSQKPRYAPILLVPVEIVRRSASSGYVIRSRDEDTMMNITMLELLRQMFDITIGGLDPLPKDGNGIDTSLVFNTVRTKIMEQRNWDVIEQAVLGNFSFNKFIMWNDIHNNSDILSESPIVSSLMSGVVDPSINVDISETEDLDKKFRAGDILLPISADSSQIEAITAALSGKSFILHGPPGTGKSQTITNIIANALYRGKKVLFVAEKMAALEVVQNRLNSIGLGPFCLELHSNKAKKSSVIAQLKRTSEVALSKSPEEYRVEAEHINSVRDEMNSCIQALHKPYPLGMSLYDCISRYASIEESCPEFAMSASLAETVTGDMVAKMEIALDDLKAVLAIIGNPSENPLRGIATTEYTAAVESALASLPEILSLIDSLEEKLVSFRGQAFDVTGGEILKEDYDFLMELCYPLSTEGVHGADALEVLGGKGGDGVKPELLARGAQGVANGENTGVEHADDVTGVGLLDDLSLSGHELLGTGQAQLFASLQVVDFLLRVKPPGHHPHKGDAVPVGLVHVGLDLKHKGGEVLVKAVDDRIARLSGKGSGGHTQEFLQKGLHTEVGQRRAKKDWGQLSMAHPLQIKVAGGTVQQLDLVHQLAVLALADQLGQSGVVHLDLSGGGGFGVGVGGEVDDFAVLAVVHALELLAAADGPVHGIGVDAQLLLQLFAQFKGVPGLPVHLVDEGEDGDVPHGAHLEQLAGLSLHALGCVNDHHRAVRRHQGAIGVLGEVLVAGGVQNVDAETLVLELHYRGGNRDAALLFDLHPVGGGSAGVLLALDLAGLSDGSAVEQELLRQGGLTGVRVRDDGKGASALDFGFVL